MVFACQKGSALCTWATPTQSLISREYRRNTVRTGSGLRFMHWLEKPRNIYLRRNFWQISKIFKDSRGSDLLIKSFYLNDLMKSTEPHKQRP